MLGIEDFKASEGWISRLKDRHGISAKAVSGEAKSVNVLTVENWKEELKVTSRTTRRRTFTTLMRQDYFSSLARRNL